MNRILNKCPVVLIRSRSVSHQMCSDPSGFTFTHIQSSSTAFLITNWTTVASQYERWWQRPRCCLCPIGAVWDVLAPPKCKSYFGFHIRNLLMWPVLLRMINPPPELYWKYSLCNISWPALRQCDQHRRWFSGFGCYSWSTAPHIPVTAFHSLY